MLFPDPPVTSEETKSTGTIMVHYEGSALCNGAHGNLLMKVKVVKEM